MSSNFDTVFPKPHPDVVEIDGDGTVGGRREEAFVVDWSARANAAAGLLEERPTDGVCSCGRCAWSRRDRRAALSGQGAWKEVRVVNLLSFKFDVLQSLLVVLFLWLVQSSVGCT